MNTAGSYDRDRALRQFTIEGCEGNAFSGDGHNGLRRLEAGLVPLRIWPAQVPALNGVNAIHLQFPQHFKKIFIIRLIGNVVDVFVSKLAFFIHNEERALGYAVILGIRAVALRYLPLSIKYTSKLI